MSVQTWPASLPQNWLLDHTEVAPRDVAAFEPMAGAPILNQISDAGSFLVNARVRIDDTQRATFISFYKDNLHRGAKPFQFTAPQEWSAGENWRLQFAHDGAYVLTARPGGWFLDMRLVFIRRVG